MNNGVFITLAIAAILMFFVIIFTILKGKAAKLIGKFNNLPREEKKLYDTDLLCKDTRNRLLIYIVIMLVGAVLSYFISGKMAYIALIAFIAYLSTDLKINPRKSFEKYKIKKNN